MTDVQQIDTSAVDAQSNGGARPNGKVANAPVSPAPVEVSRPPAPPRVDKRDPRYLALRNFAISMSVFNILGYAVLGFEQPWTWPLFAVAVGYAVAAAAWLSTRMAACGPTAVVGAVRHEWQRRATRRHAD